MNANAQKKLDDAPAPQRALPWYRLLNGYQWFVLILCTLGWTFDCLDQQLFALSRSPALAELLNLSEADSHVSTYAGYATCLMLLGWATGGIIFGICGDKYGRVRTMFWSILIYAGFTGLTGLARNVPEFLILRFLTGLGVGGQFAVCVTIVAESMPQAARPYALGFLQAISAVGNVSAAFITMGIGELIKRQMLPWGWTTWRWSFMVGLFPVLLLLFIRHLQEPEAWRKAKEEQKSGGKRIGSIMELFTDAFIRRRIILGMLLATVGVIGFWGIMLFAIDLNRSVFRKNSELANQKQNVVVEQQILGKMFAEPAFAKAITDGKDSKENPNKLTPDFFMSLPLDAGTVDVGSSKIFAAMESLIKSGKEFTQDNLTAALAALKIFPVDANGSAGDAPAKAAASVIKWAPSAPKVDAKPEALVQTISAQKKEYDHIVGFWGALTSILINAGAFFGMYSFAIITVHFGRRPTFTLFFLAAMVSVLAVFLMMDTFWEVCVFVPLMGFSLASLMGGYTIYFPELFPTRLRSTSVSFCYNVGRYLAAVGPGLFGGLTAYVFTQANGFSEPLRYAGAALSPIFLLGVIIIWMLPETKDKPLPE